MPGLQADEATQRLHSDPTIHPKPKVVMVTGKANRGWTEPNNTMIRDLPLEYPNVIVVDWEREVENCVGACLTKDGIHLDTDGRVFYAELIFRALGRL